MAGGMNKRGSGVPLGERRRAGVPDADVPDCPVRHCWVASVDRPGVRRPGLLVEWRRGAVAWEGRVVYAASLRAGEWSLVEEWLPAHLLAPILSES